MLSSLQLPELRLESADKSDRTIAVSRLRTVTRAGTASAADSLFMQLSELVDDYAPAGAEVTELLLRRDLSGTPLARSPLRTQAWEILDGLAGRLRDRTHFRLADSSAELSLDREAARQALVTEMTEASTAPAALVVIGEPDVGKSALTLRAADQLAEAGVPVTTLSLRDLPATTVELETLLGGPLTDVLGATATGTGRLLVVDGAEAALEGRGQLLAEVAAAALRAGLGVVAVTRADGCGAARTALQDALVAAGLTGPPREHEVPRLIGAEIDQVTAAFATLTRLGKDSRAAWLLGRPGLVDLLLRAGAGAALPTGPLSEADVFAAVWRQLVRRGEVTVPGGPSPDARERALVALARRYLLPEGLSEPPDAAALPSLRSDGLLLPPGATSAWNPSDQFASDLVRDLSIARLLLTGGWDLLSRAGAPRWALRAARLACQATLAAAEADSEIARATTETVFGNLAALHGQRWAEVPLEALLTLGTAKEALARAWPSLLADRQEGLQTVLRLALQRYTTHGVGEATILEPLVALAYCGADDVGQHDRYNHGGAGRQVRDLVLAWLNGLIQAGSGPLALRQQVRDRILASDPESYDEFAVEALALLGPDLGEQAEAFLRGLAETGGGHLAPAVESAGAVIAMSAYHPELLLTLTERFYIIPSPDPGDTYLVFNGGIRPHHKVGVLTGGLAAWYYGPFFRLLNVRPVDTLALINRMLDHAASVRISGTAGLQAAPGGAQRQPPPGLDLDLPGVGTRNCAGEYHLWSWYRGGSIGPSPCVSALLAVERFADYLLDTLRLPAARVVELLLHDCHNLAMPGLAAGLMVRHPDLAGNLMDGWLARPELWHLEAARAAAEGHLHVQGADPPDLPGRDRRGHSFRHVAAAMTKQAKLAGDQERLDTLAVVGDELVQRARELLGGSGDTGREMATVEDWAAVLRPENYYARQGDDGGLIIEYKPPEDIAERLASNAESLRRADTALRLQTTYSRSDERPVPIDALTGDLAAARDLAENPPFDGPVHPVDPIAAVAAATVMAHAQGRAGVPDHDLRWSAEVLCEVAARPWADAISRQIVFPIGADRSAAAALPALLLPAFDNSGLDSDAVREALRHSATSPPDEVRVTFARATACIWAAPCGPVGAPGTCRHQVVWSAVLDGLRACRLGRWDQAGRRIVDPLDEPFDKALPGVEAERLLLNRLTGPLIAAAAAARSDSCVVRDAESILDALLAADRRGTLYRGAHGPRLPNDQHGPATARVLAEMAAAGNPRPLMEHVRAFAHSTQVLCDLLHDLAITFTYDDTLRPALPGTWRPVMKAALDEIESNPELLHDPHWSDRTLGALIPAPQLDVADTHTDASQEHAQQNWADPGLFADLISRWLPIACGKPEAIDALVELARCGPPAWQATVGLAWIEDLIGGRYAAVAGQSWFLAQWLETVRAAGQLDTDGTARWRRIVDGLAAGGDSRAARLQQAEE